MDLLFVLHQVGHDRDVAVWSLTGDTQWEFQTQKSRSEAHFSDRHFIRGYITSLLVCSAELRLAAASLLQSLTLGAHPSIAFAVNTMFQWYSLSVFAVTTDMVNVSLFAAVKRRGNRHSQFLFESEFSPYQMQSPCQFMGDQPYRS